MGFGFLERRFIDPVPLILLGILAACFAALIGSVFIAAEAAQEDARRRSEQMAQLVGRDVVFPDGLKGRVLAVDGDELQVLFRQEGIPISVSKLGLNTVLAASSDAASTVKE